jgi:hypothetical protein
MSPTVDDRRHTAFLLDMAGGTRTTYCWHEHPGHHRDKGGPTSDMREVYSCSPHFPSENYRLIQTVRPERSPAGLCDFVYSIFEWNVYK